MKIKILFLYTELAGYFLSCVNQLAEKGVEVHLIHLPVNAEAPFMFSKLSGINCYEKNKYNAKQLVKLAEKISPDAIYCSGWKQKDYLKVCVKFKNHIPVIVGFDNHWSGSFKQQVASVFSNILLHKYFSHCWVPGNPQLEYAHRLKFSESNTLLGLYSCNYNLYHNFYLKAVARKQEKFPHRFIFIGRYYTFKGIEDLWKAFIELGNEIPNDWELWCLGTGDIKPIKYPKIKHFGFVQPENIESYILETGVFVLPSRFEPWGVAVHEFATAGFPLICSTRVGAAEMFLKNELNGFLFEPGDIGKLKEILKKIITMTDVQLVEMGNKSAELAKQITPEEWSETLLSVMDQK